MRPGSQPVAICEILRGFGGVVGKPFVREIFAFLTTRLSGMVISKIFVEHPCENLPGIAQLDFVNPVAQCHVEVVRDLKAQSVQERLGYIASDATFGGSDNLSATSTDEISIQDGQP